MEEGSSQGIRPGSLMGFLIEGVHGLPFCSREHGVLFSPYVRKQILEKQVRKLTTPTKECI